MTNLICDNKNCLKVISPKKGGSIYVHDDDKDEEKLSYDLCTACEKSVLNLLQKGW